MPSSSKMSSWSSCSDSPSSSSWPVASKQEGGTGGFDKLMCFMQVRKHSNTICVPFTLRAQVRVRWCCGDHGAGRALQARTCWHIHYVLPLDLNVQREQVLHSRSQQRVTDGPAQRRGGGEQGQMCIGKPKPPYSLLETAVLTAYIPYLPSSKFESKYGFGQP